MKSPVRIALVATLSVAIAAGCAGSNNLVTPPSTATVSTADLAPSTTGPPATINLTAAEVVSGLRNAGLPIAAEEVFDESTDPNSQLGRPGQYTSKASFADSRLGGKVDGVEGGGDVEAFDDQDALTRRDEYLRIFAEEPPIGGWYQYTVGNVILRITFDLTPDQAGQYEEALRRLFE